LAALAPMSWPGGHRIPVMRVHLAVLDHGGMDPAPALYAIRIIGATVLSAFPAMTSRRDGAHTVLTGLLDRSALYGVLAEIEALGLDLLEVRQLSRPRRSAESGDYLSP
jgi:hypothetical protein